MKDEQESMVDSPLTDAHLSFKAPTDNLPAPPSLDLFEPISAHTWRTIVDALPDPIFILDRQGHYRACFGGNPELLLLPPDQLIGSTLEEVLPAETARLLRTAIARVCKHGDSELIEYELPIHEVVHYREARLVALGADQVLAVVRDVTDTKRAELAREQAEVARRESNTLLHSIGDNLPNGYLYQLIIAPDGAMRYTYLSAGVERTTGIAISQAMQDSSVLIAQVLEEDQTAMTAASRAALVNMSTYAVEVRKRISTGEIRWALIRSAPRPPLADGSVIWDGIVLDITELRQAEQALRDSMRRYHALFHVSNVGIVITDAAGVMIEVNNAFATMLGYTPVEMAGRHFVDITHPEERAAEMERVDLALADPGAGMRPWFEKRYLHRNGATVWVRLAVELLRDELGQPWIMTAVVADITASKLAEADLLLRDQALQAISQGVIICDYHAPDLPIIYANQGFLQITGYQEAEVLGRNCRFLQGAETDPAAITTVRTAIAERRSCFVQLLNYRKDGQPFWNALALSPVRDQNGEVTHYIGIQTDISEFKQLEAEFRQAQKMEAIGRLAGGLAHDFNNLLTVINGYGDMMLQTMALTDKLRPKIEQIRIAGERATTLTRQLLAFSRKQITQPVVLNLNSMVLNLQQMLQRLIGEDIYLATLLEPELWSIKVDSSQFEQVIMNLVVNARDAMPQGGRLTIATSNVELSRHDVETYPRLSPGPHVMLTVVDTGHGIDASVLPHLFEPFFTTKPAGQGTGLGLATAYGIVEQCGGIIDVYSKVGQGAIFKLLIPRTFEAGKANPSASPSQMTRTLRTGTILLVEDEHQIRNLASSVLREEGYEVIEASNGLDALEQTNRGSWQVDLLVTDVIMPGMNGRQLSDQLTELHPELKVLFVSGYSHDLLSAQGVLDPNMTLLSKPYTPLTLQNKVHEMLDA